MNLPEDKLAAALRERRALIADEASRRDAEKHLVRLKLASEKIAAAASDLPSPIHPELAHFLARCSYDKALAFLEDKAQTAADRRSA